MEVDNKKKMQTTRIKDKFGNSSHDILEEEFKANTVGLISKEEFRRKRENIDNITRENLR